MSTILFSCDVTEFDIMPAEENDKVCFALNNKCLVINLMNSKKDKVLLQTEIERDSAIELAKLILLKYNVKQ